VTPAPIDVAGAIHGWQVALPAITALCAAFVVMLADLAMRGTERDGVAVVGVLGLGATMAVAIGLWLAPVVTGGFHDTLRADPFALFFAVVVCVGATFTVLMSIDYLRDHPMAGGDYYALVLLSTCGMILMAAANDLIVIFLALEIMSVAIYVLAGILRTDPRSNEAALKYFFLGAFASGFLLYGTAFLFGASGSTQLDAIGRVVAKTPDNPLVWLGLALLVVGFGFKVAMVPFHAWAPDVYEGAPTTITAFMAVGVKAAAFAAFGRVLAVGFGAVTAGWANVLWIVAVATMTVGNVTAISQRNVKRMLAYSSIAHAGYALLGLVAGTRAGGAALCVYLAVYTLMNLGAFAVLIALGRRGEPCETLDDLAGMGWRQPLLGIAMTIFMLSLAGFPPTAGFAGKLALFAAAIDAGYVGLVVIAVLNSVVSVYYYLGVLVQMYMVEGDRAGIPPTRRPALLATIVLTMALVLFVGIAPSRLFQVATTAFASLR
jgi:NADH-quinone oxidoreductase subunit N